MSSIHAWLDRAQAEFKTPEEMRAAAEKCIDRNTKKLLISRAGTWGAKLLADGVQHWSKAVTHPKDAEIYAPTRVEGPNPRIMANPRIRKKSKPNPRIRSKR